MPSQVASSETESIVPSNSDKSICMFQHVMLDGCSQTKPEVHTGKMQCQMFSDHDGRPVTGIAMSDVDTEGPASAAVNVCVSVEEILPSVSIQNNAEVPVVLRPPGPMLSHWEYINDSDVPVSGEEIQFISDHIHINSLSNGSDVRGEMKGEILKDKTLAKRDEHNLALETKGEKEEKDYVCSPTGVLMQDVLTMPASSLLEARLAPNESPLKGTSLAPGNLHSDKNANVNKDELDEDTRDGKPKMDVTLKPSEKQVKADLDQKSISTTALDITKPYISVQDTDQNAETQLIISHDSDDNFFYKSDAISKSSITELKMSAADSFDVSFGKCILESEDSMINIQSSQSASAKQNSLTEIKTSGSEESCEIDSFESLSRVTTQLNASDSNLDLSQVPTEDACSFVKAATVIVAGTPIQQLGFVNTEEMNQTHYEGEENMIKPEQLEIQQCAKEANLKFITVKQDEQLIKTQSSAKEEEARKLKELKNTDRTKLLEEQKEMPKKEMESVHTNEKQILINVDHDGVPREKTDLREEKHFEETFPGKPLKATVLSDPCLNFTGFIKEAQSCGEALTEDTHPSMDQNLSAALPLVEEACCETTYTYNQSALSELDLAPCLDSQPSGLQCPWENMDDQETELNEDSEKDEGVCLENAKVSYLSFEEQAKGNLESETGVESSCSGLEKVERITLLGGDDNSNVEGEKCHDGKKSEKEPKCKPKHLESVSSIIKSMSNIMSYSAEEDENQEDQRVEIDNQECKTPGSSTAAPENTGVKLDLRELLVSVINESLEMESKSSDFTRESQVSGKPVDLERATPTNKVVQLAINDSTKPLENSHTSHCEFEHKTEDQCFSITHDNSRCTEVCTSAQTDDIVPSVSGTLETLSAEQAEPTIQLTAKQPDTNVSPLLVYVVHEKTLSENLDDASHHTDNAELLFASTDVPIQTEAMALELEEHSQPSPSDPSSLQNTVWKDITHSQQCHTELVSLETYMETEEETRNIKTQATILEESKQTEHKEKEINGSKEEREENESADQRELTEMTERSFECDVKDGKGNNNNLPEQTENSDASVSKIESRSTNVSASYAIGGLQSELKQDSPTESSFCPESIVSMVTNSQDAFQALLNANAQSSTEAIQPFVQIQCENALKTENEKDRNSTYSAHGEVNCSLMQEEKTDDHEGTKQSNDQERSDSSLRTSILPSEYTSDSPGQAVRPVMELTEETVVPGKEESCESSNWLRTLREAASVSQTQEYKVDIPHGPAGDRPFETLNLLQAEQEFCTPVEDSAAPVKEPLEDPPDSRCPLTEAAESSECVPSFPPPPEEHAFSPALPAHLLQDSAEFPTPPPTPPERAPQEPGPAHPTPPSDPDQPCPAAALLDQLQDTSRTQEDLSPPVRSSDSDGAFETPESTTPVKTATSPVAPAEQPQASPEPLPSGGSDSCPDSTNSTTVDVPASDVLGPLSSRPPSRSLSTVFDENKPIASSGSYNLDHILIADPPLPAVDPSGVQSRTPLTRSLSLQSGELDSSSTGDRPGEGGGPDKSFHPRTESFSIGTESAPGTLRRVKKPRPSSLKKKTLSRQNSNPESTTPRSKSSTSTPELQKRETSPNAESPLQAHEEQEQSTPVPSLGAADPLRSRVKSQVETSPPVVEESSPTSAPAATQPQEEAPPVPDGDTPFPPSGSYKWDPDNFENIDPFCTGGSKLANSPVVGRKVDFARDCETAKSPTVPAEESPADTHSAPPAEPPLNIEEQPITKWQSVRLEFDYSEETGETPQSTPLPPKKLGKKPGAKMPLRKPKLGIKKAPPPQTEQLDNAPAVLQSNDNDDILIPKATYNFDPNKWDDPNFNPFSSSKGIPNSPSQSRASYSFDPNSFDDSTDPFKSSNKMGNSPPKAASFEMSSNDNENDNDIGELEDLNQNKPAKNKKKPLKSNTFRVKRSPKRSPVSDMSAQCCPVCPPLLPSIPHTHHQPQEPSVDPMADHAQDHATDEEKLASSSNQKWVARHDVEVELTADVHDFPQPSDLTAFVTEGSLPAGSHDYEIEYMEKIGTSSPPLSVQKPSLYLNLDPVTESSKQSSNMHDSGPNSPCTGSFEEMEAQISAEGKSPVLQSRGAAPDPPTLEKNRKRESQPLSCTQNSEPDAGSRSDLSLLDRLSESAAPINYLEPDLAETNPTAFAHKLQEELVLAALRIEALQVAQNISQSPSLSTVSPQREVASPGDSGMSKSSLYSQAGYSEGESPYLPRDLDHSLGIAREEIVAKEKEVLEWQRKYEESRQELEEMRKIVAEYEKTIAQMIEKPFVIQDSATEDEQRGKSLSHHTIQQLIVEKDQALADLNSVEKSLADLFRRYEKMKDVLEGFRKNEEVLKKCAQEYLSRVRKEEQRYQALKIHAEEKLDKANAEIAQVRAKAKQEQAAYQASLRKEQMKVDSLERTLEQKNKEIEELTKICDELIAKMGKS
ncbi:uncharacterized protein tacc2 isoform X6 [Electrophorus electricus]|uniref:uncharacterized protein tacc2 isoform X6 n=1 Tax=Electrophorus electricus TaxID=8005 RepID=UPI0015D00D47|nr:uncharacterized protein tacc2 isoform X6 [Electrophorus electricus]